MTKRQCKNCGSEEVYELSKSEDPIVEGEKTLYRTTITFECESCRATWAETKDKSEFVKAVEKHMQNSLANVDLQLQEYKEVYKGMDDANKELFRQILSDVSAIQDQLHKLWGHFRLRFCVINEFTDPDTGEVGYSGYGELGPKYVLHALDAWDKGEEFTKAPPLSA